MRRKQIAIAILITVAVSAWIYLDLSSYLQLESIQQNIGDLRSWYAENPLLAWFIYFIVYVVATALSVPGAVFLTLAGGALLGFWYGLLLVSFPAVLAPPWPFWCHAPCCEIGCRPNFPGISGRSMQALSAMVHSIFFPCAWCLLFPLW